VTQPSSIRTESFGTTPGGRDVGRTSLSCGELGLETISYGAAIVSLRVPDRDGRVGDVVLGFDELAGYVADRSYQGVVVGRYGGRIARGRFTLGGREHRLATNDGPNHLHGGQSGFDKRVWRGETFRSGGDVGVTYALRSEDGDEGYPGTVDARVTYTLRRDGLVIEYEALCDLPTPLNLTQHAYFDLGAGQGDALSHELTIHGVQYVPVDAELLPSGTFAPVAGTPFDFRSPTPIGARIEADDVQLAHGRGYDHDWIVDGPLGALRVAALVVDPGSGRTLEVSTTEPAVHLYSGNFLDGARGKAGRVHRWRSAFCLETQHLPDSPNRPQFPSTIVHPGTAFRSRTVWRLGRIA
jgi:aldose 1-epimerase